MALYRVYANLYYHTIKAWVSFTVNNIVRDPLKFPLDPTPTPTLTPISRPSHTAQWSVVTPPSRAQSHRVVERSHTAQSSAVTPRSGAQSHRPARCDCAPLGGVTALPSFIHFAPPSEAQSHRPVNE
eukprot:9494157-Pyramimonas_sp.AAC.2